MGRYSDAQILRFGAVTLVILLLVMAAAFNLSKFPGFGGTTYYAELADASGLREGNMVQVAGMRAGRVQEIRLAGDRAVVEFTVDDGFAFGNDSRASVEVLNLLGEKYLELFPEGPGQMPEVCDQSVGDVDRGRGQLPDGQGVGGLAGLRAFRRKVAARPAAEIDNGHAGSACRIERIELPDGVFLQLLRPFAGGQIQPLGRQRLIGRPALLQSPPRLGNGGPHEFVHDIP